MQTDTAPKYRTYESRWSPNNRAAREARQIEAQTKAGVRRDKRTAERLALRAEAMAKLHTPAMLSRREAALAAAGAMVASMATKPMRSPAMA